MGVALNMCRRINIRWIDDNVFERERGFILSIVLLECLFKLLGSIWRLAMGLIEDAAET